MRKRRVRILACCCMHVLRSGDHGAAQHVWCVVNPRLVRVLVSCMLLAKRRAMCHTCLTHAYGPGLAQGGPPTWTLGAITNHATGSVTLRQARRYAEAVAQGAPRALLPRSRSQNSRAFPDILPATSPANQLRSEANQPIKQTTQHNPATSTSRMR